MSAINPTESYNEIREDFIKVCKRILKEQLTQNRVKHIEYIYDLIEAYNKSINFLAERYPRFDEVRKKGTKTECKYLRDK